MTTEIDPAQTPENPGTPGNPDTPSGFAALGLTGKLLAALDELGYEEPTPIQRESIPTLITGRDVIGQAATGTGKTAAFALPLVHRLASADRDKPRPQPSALILVPTRELAMQVAEAVHRYGRALGVTVLPVYGGAAFGQQVRSLDRGVDVVVATPGRILDHIRRETINLAGINAVILDEADEMLDMGFADDLEAILKEVPDGRQTVLFSATLPPRIAGIAKRHLKDPVKIQVAAEKPKAGAAPKVRQTAYIVQRSFKLAALGRVLDVENPTAALVFCRTRVQVDELTEKLTARGYRAQPLHGGISQDQRSRVIKQIKAGESDLVIATDVAARGLDIDQLTHVVNYDVPSNPESYVHRIGRVGRAGREGVAITFADPRESRLLRIFEKAAKHKIDIAQVPTIADLRAKRLQLTRAALQESLLSDDLDHFRVVVESLAQEHDLMNVALAAVKLIHQHLGADDEEAEDIPAAPSAPPARTWSPRETGDRPAPRSAPRPAPRSAPRSADRPAPRPRPGAPKGGRPNPGMVRLFIGGGRNFGIRPQDIVGAIAGEAGLSGRSIGAIDIADTFSVVEVPADAARDVVAALRRSTIKGKKVPVRPDRNA